MYMFLIEKELIDSIFKQRLSSSSICEMCFNYGKDNVYVVFPPPKLNPVCLIYETQHCANFLLNRRSGCLSRRLVRGFDQMFFRLLPYFYMYVCLLFG